MKSKEKLIFEAFKLYAAKSYTDVTLADMETATGLSRGAILYHFKKKEDIFFKVIEDYIFRKSSVSFIKEKYRENLFSFITQFIKMCKAEQKEMLKIGIENINFAMFSIEMSAFNYYPDMKEKAKEWHENETKIWLEVIGNAVKNKEIKSVDSSIIAEFFEDLYIGASFVGVTQKDGFNVDKLEKRLLALYDLIKA